MVPWQLSHLDCPHALLKVQKMAFVLFEEDEKHKYAKYKR
jgi:hypothetical protein